MVVGAKRQKIAPKSPQSGFLPLFIWLSICVQVWENPGVDWQQHYGRHACKIVTSHQWFLRVTWQPLPCSRLRGVVKATCQQWFVSERSAFYFCGRRFLAAMGSHIRGCRVDSVSRSWCSAPVIQSWFGSSRFAIYKLLCSLCFGRSWGNLVLCLQTRVNPFPLNFCSPYDLGKRWHSFFCSFCLFFLCLEKNSTNNAIHSSIGPQTSERACLNQSGCAQSKIRATACLFHVLPLQDDSSINCFGGFDS